MNDLEGGFVNACHEIAVKGADAALGVVRLDLIGDELGAGDDDLEATAHPKQRLDDSLDELVVLLVMTRAFLEYLQSEYGDKTVVSLKTNGERLAALSGNGCLKIAVYDRHGHKAGVERCIYFKLHKWFFLS